MTMKKKLIAISIAIWIVFSSAHTVHYMFAQVLFPSQETKAARLVVKNEELQHQLKLTIQIQKYEGENKRLSEYIDDMSEK